MLGEVTESFVEVVAKMVEEQKIKIIGFHAAFTFAIAALSVQAKAKLPDSFEFVSITSLLCLLCFVSAMIIDFSFKTFAKVLYFLGAFFCMTSYLIAAAIPSQMYFHVLLILLFLISCITLVILMSNTCSPPNSTTNDLPL
uniref:Uncharacterized protein n=1 Tax=Cucumis sativus TaxID=3659 RepID=A0A0A0LEV1_CUCSA